MNDIFTYSQKNGSTIFTFPGDSGIIGTTKKNLDFTRVSLA